MIRKMMVLMAALFLLSPAITFAADFCAADNNGDCKVDLTDLVTMKSEFMKPDCEACSPAYPAPVAKTGQIECYDETGNPRDCSGTGSDGDLQKGVAWPNPRFTDNRNGTVMDNLTGLIWLDNANCFDLRTWSQALTDCNGLNDGECVLTDGSQVGDWRLPNKNELNTLIDAAYHTPALSNTEGTGQWTEGNPFTNVQSTFYWSSTEYAVHGAFAWGLSISNGLVTYDVKSNYGYVWPVRGPQ